MTDERLVAWAKRFFGVQEPDEADQLSYRPELSEHLAERVALRIMLREQERLSKEPAIAYLATEAQVDPRSILQKILDRIRRIFHG
jgi:hypothetical protein